MERIPILDVEFDNVTLREARERLIACIEKDEALYVVTPNPEFVYACYKNQSLKPLLNGAGLCVPDGIGVIYAAKILRTPLKERVPGIELGESLIAWAAENGKSVFCLGAKPGVAESAGEKLREKYPGLVIAGYHDGYFKEDEPVVRQVAASGASIVLCCMGFPRQERFMSEHLAESGAKVMLGLGGSLDVFAGNVKRAPAFFCKTGLEWFYRLIKEPSRIGRMMKLPKFLFIIIRERLLKSGKKE